MNGKDDDERRCASSASGVPVRVVSAFSGAGFADYALHRASEQTGIPVEVVLAFDSWPKAVEVYNANLPSRAIVADAKALTRADFPAHDLFIGGPPCQSHSTAGPKDCHCHVGGPASPRCCLADFQRLASGSAYLMENVRSRLINAPWSEQLCAADFGDVTDRRRWFYSDHLLHVVRTPGPRRIRDIRDRAADVPENDVSKAVARKKAIEEERQGRNYGFPPRTDDDFLGSIGGASSNRLQSGSTLIALRQGARSADAWWAGGKRRTVSLQDDAGFFGSPTGQAHHANTRAELLAVGGARNPTRLEMQRAHSIPEDWVWPKKGVLRGQLIANGWPIGMGTAVLAAALRAVAATRDLAV